MINKIKILLEKLLNEDTLDLSQKLVEIGVLSYLSQKGLLNTNRERRLLKHIGDATDDIQEVIVKWLFDHGLRELAERLEGDYDSFKEEEIFSGVYDLEGLLEDLQYAVSEDDYSTKMIKEINNFMGEFYILVNYPRMI